MKTEADLWRELDERIQGDFFLCNEIDALEWRLSDDKDSDEYMKITMSMRLKVKKWVTATRGPGGECWLHPLG